MGEESAYVEAVEDSSQSLGRYLDGDVFSFDLLLPDTDLAGVDGFSLCRELRPKISVPIVMLSDRSDEVSVVVVLEVGADDYVTRPFNVRGLMSRVRAHLRCRSRNAITPMGMP